MKNKLIFVLVIMNFINNTQAQIGCMDNSKHTYICDGFDYKNYEYVYCTCPCYRYKWSFKRGRCEKCLHFHDAHHDVIID